MRADFITQAVDAKAAADQDDGRRRHLGGSLIGRACSRMLWYSFRWAVQTKFEGRIVRLFQRGHREEFRFVEYLESIGCEVRAYAERLCYSPEMGDYITVPWDKDWTRDPIGATFSDVSNDEHHIARAVVMGVELEQYRISDVDGHYGGSLDGMARYIPGVERLGLAPDTWGLTEYKTHGEKSFVKLAGKRQPDGSFEGGEGVRKAKPEHYAQMQSYMHKRELAFALYMAVNKNTDDMYCELIPAEAIDGAATLSKAREIIHSRTAPPRISKSPSWFECRFCDFKDVCHAAAPLDVHCRTCKHAVPIAGGEWHCDKWGNTIPTDFMKQGCGDHSPVTD